MEDKIRVEVVYGLAHKQKLLALDVDDGCTMMQAVEQSGIVKFFPDEIDLSRQPMGIFGKAEANPAGRVLKAGERVELYRPLLVDPKATRKARAAKVKAQKSAQP